MKQILLSVFSVFAAAAMALAQDYSPTTTWPYRYDDFRDGVIHFMSGGEKTGKFNVSLDGNALHFIEGSEVKVLSSGELFSVKIGNDYYQNVGGQILKVLAKSDKAIVVEESTIDFVSLNATGGAYGSSSSSTGTTALSSLEGIGGTRSNMNHMELKNNKENGKVLPLITKIYMVAKGYKVYAAKKDFLEVPSMDKAKAAAFLKSAKIKWKDPQSVLLAADFLSEQL